MKKLIELIRNKDREEKTQVVAKKASAKEDKTQQPSASHEEQIGERPNELFWDDYSDLGFC